MNNYMKFLSLFACCLLAATSAATLHARLAEKPSNESTPFESKLDRRIKQFDITGQTIVTAALTLAYEHKLPLAFEYVDRAATTKPVTLHFRGESIREIFKAIVAQNPQYRVSFSGGIIDIYAPTAREDSSSLLNKVIKNFNVVEMDTHSADLELFCALARQIETSGVCGGSIATGQWGRKTITLHFQNAKTYEILNAIVAQNGQAVWIVAAPPDKLSKIPVGGLWHIYPLEEPYKGPALEKLTRIPLD